MAVWRPAGGPFRTLRVRVLASVAPVRKSTGRRGRSLGQSMVEFVLVLPVLFFLLGAAIDLGRLFYGYVAVENAAKEGALAGSRQPLCDTTGVAICANPNNVVWHVKNEAPNLVDGSGNSLLSTTIACRQPDGTLVQSITDCLDGYTYQVTVSMPFKLITPLLSSVMPANFTLTKESEATVVTDAFDPSGLEVLIWANTSNSLNTSEITSNCTLADPIQSPGYYYQPCQDGSNVDHYLQFNEGSTVSYKVRVRNTGNITLTNITYAFSENSIAMGSAPGNCGSTLPTTLAANSAAVYCSFTRSASPTNAAGASSDDIVSIQTSALASGLSAGTNATNTDVKVVPAPRLAVNLQAAPWRLGGTTGNGDGNGNPQFSNGNLTLNRDTSSSSAEIQNPTGWLYLTVQNQGGPANNFSTSVTRAGSAIALPAWCNVPTALSSAGQAGDTFRCAIPQTFTTTATTAFAATATATSAQTVGGTQPNVSITTALCSGKKVVPNLVDNLSPADGNPKTVTTAQAVWTAAGFTGALTTNPAGALGTTTVSSQTQTAYTCQNANSTVTVTAP